MELLPVVILLLLAFGVNLAVSYSTHKHLRAAWKREEAWAKLCKELQTRLEASLRRP